MMALPSPGAVSIVRRMQKMPILTELSGHFFSTSQHADSIPPVARLKVLLLVLLLAKVRDRRNSQNQIWSSATNRSGEPSNRLFVARITDGSDAACRPFWIAQIAACVRLRTRILRRIAFKITFKGDSRGWALRADDLVG